jgi:hypothetical protein
MMTNPKILFWFDVDLEQFCISKFLQDVYDGDFYAIIDINNQAKSFFESQQLVNFKKIWYYRDFLLKLDSIPNMDYLKSFEKNYNINLWNLAYTERYFLNFNNYYDFKKNEILYLFEQEIILFEKIIDEVNPDFIIMKVSDYHQNHLFHEICKRKKIKILTLSNARISNKTILSTDADILDEEFLSNSINTDKVRSFKEIQKLAKQYSKYQSNFRKEDRVSLVKKLNASLKFFLYVCNSDYRKFYANYGRTRFKVFLNEFLFIFKRFYREQYQNKISINSINTNHKFIYFPLHLEPERSFLITAPYFTNQLEVISYIAKSLPIDYKLYVKDHPGMSDKGWRNIEFYKKITQLPNVILINPSISNEKLIESSSMVITIAGTASMTAAFYEKPSAVFTNTLFSKLSSIVQIKNITELTKVIDSLLNVKVDLKELNSFIDYLEKNTIDFGIIQMNALIGSAFYHGGFLKDTKISEEQMQKFLTENKIIFENLALEYVKKLN